MVAESYVNLIPTTQGGTHVNGLRTGFADAMREFCEFRSLLPRGVKLAPEESGTRGGYVLSLKLGDPQFSGQTKERLSSREGRRFCHGVVKDSFSLWLNQHTQEAEKLAGHVASAMHGAACVWRNRVYQQGKSYLRPRPARQAGRLLGRRSRPRRTFPGGGRLCRRLGETGAQPRVSRPFCRCAARY